jgi:hypothetical protein
MAKISTYPFPSSPTLSDKLIGTDLNDMLMTKNFTISDIISVAGSSTYVPYTGATTNVDLGAYDITATTFIKLGGLSTEFLKADGSIDSNTYALASSLASYVPYVGATNNLDLGGNDLIATTIIKSGGLATEFLKADGSVDSNTYLTTAIISGLVPYTGATGNVDLGANRLTATSLRITTDDAEMIGISCFPGAQDFFEIGNNGWTVSGFLVDFVNNRYFLGDWGSAVNGTYIKVDDANTRIELSKGIYTNGTEGSSGQVLTSQGAGLPATWSTPFVVPTLGSFYDTTVQGTAGTAFEVMQFNSTDISTGVSIVNDGLGDPTKITFSISGVYNIQFSAQLKKIGGGGATLFYIYLIKDGVPVPDSTTAVTLENNGDLLVAAWNWFITISLLPSYCQIGWYTNDANGELHYDAAPVVGIPAIPSVILTVNRVS